MKMAAAAFVVTLLIIEAIDVDGADSSEAFGQGGIVGNIAEGQIIGDYFSGDFSAEQEQSGGVPVLEGWS